MAANINGPALSSLLFTFITESGDQEGFLLGNLVSHVQDNISDSQLSNYKVETRLYMQSYCPWPASPRLYSNTGDLDHGAMLELLKERQKEVIGWYRFRRNSSLKVSMRESSLHQSLLKQLAVSVADQSHFLFLLCSSSASGNLSTHNLDHTFLVFSKGHFVKLPARVVNLGDTVNSDYQLQPSAGISSTSLRIQSVLREFQKDFEDADGEMLEVKRVHSLSDSLHSQLQGLAKMLVESDRTRELLEEEVRGLAARVQHLEERKRQLHPPPPQPLPPGDDFRAGGATRPDSSCVDSLLTLENPGQSLHVDQLPPQRQTNGGASQASLAPMGARPAPEEATITERPKPMETDSLAQEENLSESGQTSANCSENGVTSEPASSSQDHFAFVDSLLNQEKQIVGAGKKGGNSGGKDKDPQRLTTRSCKRGDAGSGRGASRALKDDASQGSCSPEIIPAADDVVSSDSSSSSVVLDQVRSTRSRSQCDDRNSNMSRASKVRGSRSSERKNAKDCSSTVSDAKGKKNGADSSSAPATGAQEEKTLDEKHDLLHQPSNSPVF